MLSTKTVNKLYKNKKIEIKTIAQKQALEISLKIRKLLEKDFPRYQRRLPGCCVLASKMLFHELNKRGIVAKIVSGTVGYEQDNFWRNQPRNPHHWVEVEGLVFDITATQFLFTQKVFVFPTKDKTKIGYKTKRFYSDLKSLRKK